MLEGEALMLSGTGWMSRVSISGYKSIHSCDLSLGKTNVLIGANGAGKSNLLSAFSFLQEVLTHNLQVAVARNGLDALCYHEQRETDEIAFEVFFGSNSYGFSLVPTEDDGLIFREEYFRSDGQLVSESIIARGHREAMWDAEEWNPADDCAKLILEKQNLRVYQFHDTGPVKQVHSVSDNKALLPDGANLAAFLYRRKADDWKCYDFIVQTIQLIAPWFSDFVLAPQEGDAEQIVLKWRQKGCADILDASQLSDGTLRFACLAALLMQPHELQPPISLIEEPELGLHPFAIVLLGETIRTLPADRQVILSTQSSDLLDEFDVEDVVVAERGETGPVFRRLDEEELTFWLEEGYSLSELWKKNLLGGRP